MSYFDDLVLECSDDRQHMEEHIAQISYEINKLKANYPNSDLLNLISTIKLLIKQCDTTLLDNEKKTNNLDLSLREIASLGTKLGLEKKQRELEMNKSFYIQEAEYDEKISLNNNIATLKRELQNSHNKCDSLNRDNLCLQNEIKHIKSQYIEKDNSKYRDIQKLKLELEIIQNEYVKCNTNPWNRNKWLEDKVINDYFTAISESIDCDDILFLGPSVTLTIRFATPDIVNDSDCFKFLFAPVRRFIFACISDCSDAARDDSGSHWSLLIFDRGHNKSYHFDSLQPLNRVSAEIVARNMGVQPNNVIEIPCIQQKKSFECGIHVLANTQYVANHYCKVNQDTPFLKWFNEAKQDRQQLIINKTENIPSTHRQPKKTTLLRTQDWKLVKNKKKNRAVHRRCLINDGGKEIRQKNRFEILNKSTDDDFNNVVNDTPYLISKINTRDEKRSILKPKINLQEELRAIQPNKHMLTVASDSQGRGLSTILGLENDGKYKIYGICQPGATIQPIMLSITNSTEFKTLSKKDCVVVIGGTNNITQQTCKNKQLFLKTYYQYIQDQLQLFSHTNIILSTIPYRYDLSANSNVNELIRDTNLMIRNLTYNQPNIKILDLYLLQSSYHTKHGLHINKRGKKYIAREIINMANSMVQDFFTTTELQSETVLVEASETVTIQVKDGDNPLTNIHIETPWKQEIEIIEADMADIINTYEHDPEVAFAHCISGDFGDQRQMSAGVAVKFRKSFGHPKASECVSNYLCIQCSKNQATVYGLITKPKYCDKPTEEDYNNALDHLTEDVLHRGFKKLVCSPLGCMRDNIHPQLFAKNIVALQKATGAAVRIIVQDERSRRNLRNGLKHHEFINILRNIILSAKSPELQLNSTDQFPPLPPSQILSIDQNPPSEQYQPLGQLPSADHRPTVDQPPLTDGPPPANYRLPAADQVNFIGDNFLG